MAQAYIRQSTFADGDTITAALFNDEYNQLVNAFAYSSSSASSTGHRHDGTAGQGGNIFKIGDLDFLNKVEIDSSNNRVGFYVEVSSAAVEQIRIQDGAIVPVTDSDIDLGTTSLRFKDTFTDSITTTGNVDVGGNLTVTGTTTFNGGTITMGDAADDNVVFGADVNSNIIPNTDNTYDLGSSSQEWKDLYVDGVAYLDGINFNGTAITSTAAELNILDGVTSTAAELNILDGVTSTTAELNILDGVTSSTAELNILDGVTATTAELNILDGVTSSTAELNILDGVTSTATELNILDGVTSTTAELNILDGVTSTAAELNILDGVTSTTAELNILDGVTSTTAELNLLDGVTATTTELNYVDVATAGTVEASKAIVVDSNKDFTGARNITITGELDAATLDVSGDVDIDGTLEADAITINGTTLAETISDTVGAMVGSNTETGISVTYDDSDNTLDFVIGSGVITNAMLAGSIANSKLANSSVTISDGSNSTAVALGGTLTIQGTSNEVEVAESSGTVTVGLPAATQVTTSLGIGGGSTNGVQISQGAISIKNGGTQSYIDFYCESSNAHYARLQAPAHSAFGGNITLTLPATTGTLALTSGDITGNAATATALATARTIHGVSFDGTANIDLTEVIQDTVGAMVTGNTESNITVTYEDSDGTLDFSVTGGGSVSEAFKTISVSGQDDVVADAAADTLTLVAGSNMTITTSASGDTITFASSGSGGSQNLFSTIAVSGQSNVVADSTTDTLTLVAGSGMTLTTDASGDSITFASSGGGSGNSTFAKDTFTGDGSTTAFTMTTSMSSEDGLIVFIDGVYQADNVYSVSGNTLTFATAPVNSRIIEVFQFQISTNLIGVAPVIATMTGDGSDTTLALGTTPSSENQTFVTIDGVVQHKDTYSVSGSTLTFSAAPPTGTKVECITFTNVASTTFEDADGDTKVQVEESTDEDKIRFDIAGTEEMVMDASGIVINDGSNDRDFRIESNDSDGMLFVDGGNNRVGVGTSSPGTILHTRTSESTTNHNAGGGFHLTSSSTAANRRAQLFLDADRGDFGTSSDGAYAYFEKVGSGGALNIINQDSAATIFQQGGAEKVRIHSNGNLTLSDSLGVGTGTSDPNSRLQIKKDGTGNYANQTFSNANSTAGITFGIAGSGTGNYLANNAFLLNTGSSAFIFGTGDTERMRIDSSGNTLFFRTSVYSALVTPGSVTTQITDDGVHIIESTSNQQVQFSTDRINFDASNFYVLNESNTGVKVVNGATSWTTQSDKNLKENIVELDSVLEKITDIQCVKYNLKTQSTDKTRIGFIAQDWQTNFEEVVVVDENGELGLNYTETIPVLLKAIQEQQEQIEALQSEINTLKGGE